MSTTLENKPAFLSQSADFGESDVQLCVQCLAAYNQGHHHFMWLDLEELNSEDEEEFKKQFQQAIDYVIKTSPAADAEEWFFTDHCGIDSIYSEYIGAEELFTYLEGLREAKAAGYSHELWENYLNEITNPDNNIGFSFLQHKKEPFMMYTTMYNKMPIMKYKVKLNEDGLITVKKYPDNEIIFNGNSEDFDRTKIKKEMHRYFSKNYSF